jgi:hypothetical protein
MYFSQFWKLSPRSRYRQNKVDVIETSSLLGWLHLGVYSHGFVCAQGVCVYDRERERERAFYGVSSYKDANPWNQVPTLYDLI